MSNITNNPQQCLDELYDIVAEFDESNYFPMLRHILQFVEEAFQDHRLDDIDYLLEHVNFDKVNRQILVSLARGSFRGRLHTVHWKSHVDKTYQWLKDRDEDVDHIMRGLMNES